MCRMRGLYGPILTTDITDPKNPERGESGQWMGRRDRGEPGEECWVDHILAD